MQRQVGDAEQAGEARERVGSVLHVPLREDVQRALERNDLTCVPAGIGGVADHEAASELVEAVEGEHRGCFARERVPQGQPGAHPTGGPGGARGRRGGGHAAVPRSSAAAGGHR
jgi:hypothetical protein